MKTTALRDSLDVARGFVQNGQYAEAEALARRILAAAEASVGADSSRVADALDVLVVSLVRGGKAMDPGSRELAERAVMIHERVLGPDHPDVAKSLNNLANLLRDTGDFSAARPLYERSLAIREKALGPDHPDVAKSLNNIAILLWNTGDFAAARPLYERALAIREKALGANDPDVAGSLNNLAILLYAIGDYAGARPLYERALAIWEKVLGPNHPDVAKNLNNLASLLWDTGDYAGARPLYERALAIQEKALGPDHPDVAASLNNLAFVLASTRDYAAARPLYERAVSITEKALGPDHPDVSESLNNLADLLRDSGDYDGARRLYERGLAITEKALGPEHPDVASNLNDLAILLQSAGDYAAARPLCERALAVQEKALGPDHPDVAGSLSNLANLRRDTGDYAVARPLYERALAIREKALGPEHPEVAVSLLALARLDDVLGRSADALNAALRAEQIGREHLRLTCQTLPERQALGYAAVRPSGLDVALTLASRGLDQESRRKIWDALLRSRSIVLDEVAGRHRQASEITRCSKDFASASERLAHLVVRGPRADSPENYRLLVDGARQEREVAERKLAEYCVALRQDEARSRLGIREVARALPAGSALVSFARYKQQVWLGPIDAPAKTPTAGGGQARRQGFKESPSYIAFVMHAGAEDAEAVALGAAAEIDSLVARWQEEVGRAPGLVERNMARSAEVPRPAGDALRRRVWDPLASRLAGAQRAFIVPDGALNLVNFAAFPAGKSGYVLESGPVIHYLSAERDLATAEFEQETQSARGLLAMGGPAFDQSPVAPKTRVARAADVHRGAHSSCVEFRSLRFVPLPASIREVQDVVALWSVAGNDARAGALQLTGAAATEAAFKRSAPGRLVLHLATHGFFLAGSCPVEIAPTRRTGSLAAAARAEPLPPDADSPLLLSGLALAGANQREQAGANQDDGILTAEEIAALDLSAVEWAVLSACETGAGEVSAGEGVFGLRRAFQVAGAKTLIMSLWGVEDEVTRQWMKELYERRFVKHLGTAEAVREASLEVLRRRRDQGESTDPFYWGGFVAAGDWR